MALLKAADMLRTKLLRELLDRVAIANNPQFVVQPGTATTGNVYGSGLTTSSKSTITVRTDLSPGGISAPMAPPEKPVKRMNEMTFADFQRGVDNWWPHRNRG